MSVRAHPVFGASMLDVRPVCQRVHPPPAAPRAHGRAQVLGFQRASRTGCVPCLALSCVLSLCAPCAAGRANSWEETPLSIAWQAEGVRQPCGVGEAASDVDRVLLSEELEVQVRSHATQGRRWKAR